MADFVQKSDFEVMKPFETPAVAGVDYHRVGQKITHVFHHSELAEFVEPRRRLIHDENVGRMDEHTGEGEALLFAARQERSPLVGFDARN